MAILLTARFEMWECNTFGTKVYSCTFVLQVFSDILVQTAVAYQMCVCVLKKKSLMALWNFTYVLSNYLLFGQAYLLKCQLCTRTCNAIL